MPCASSTAESNADCVATVTAFLQWASLCLELSDGRELKPQPSKISYPSPALVYE